MAKRGVHDMGGSAAGAVDTHEHAPSLAERRIDALMQVLRQKPRSFWTTDENRRTIESLTPKAYNDAGYYERWAIAMRGLLIEKGVLSEAEIAKRFAEVKARHVAGTIRLTKGKLPATKSAKAKADNPRAKAAVASARRANSVVAPKTKGRGR